MTTSEHLAMHQQHRDWASEISLWRDNLRVWQHDVTRVLSELAHVQKSLEDHAHALRLHASQLRLQEMSFEGHEHALAEYERGGEGTELLPLARQHGDEETHQTKSRELHEQFKRKHEALIAHWNSLLKLLGDQPNPTASAPSQKNP